MSSEGHTASLCALAGLTGFMCGAYFNHEVTIRNLLCLIKNDPYAYHNRRKLFNIMTLFKSDVERRLKGQNNVSDKIRDCIMQPFYELCKFLFIVRSARCDSPNLMELMKYGFPGTEDIRVHRDYVISYDARTNGAHWVCEHLTQEMLSRKSGECHRFNDVNLLTNGANNIGQAFKSKVWHGLERYVTELTEKYGSVYIYSGPLYLPVCKDKDWTLEYQVINWLPIPVPSHFFKVLVVDSQLVHCSPYMEGYIIPNKVCNNSSDLRKYLSEIDEIERYSGLKFISGLRHNLLFKNENYTYIDSSTKLGEKPDKCDKLSKKLAGIYNTCNYC